MKWIRLSKELPLKQGLKLEQINEFIPPEISLSKELPLKQGLKLLSFQLCCVKIILSKELPLKQGLKPRLLHYAQPRLAFSQRNFH